MKVSYRAQTVSSDFKQTRSDLKGVKKRQQVGKKQSIITKEKIENFLKINGANNVQKNQIDRIYNSVTTNKNISNFLNKNPKVLIEIFKEDDPEEREELLKIVLHDESLVIDGMDLNSLSIS